ncbi:MAG: hypothetical protein ACJ8M1_09325 [Chthoniobacterales bacterium]
MNKAAGASKIETVSRRIPINFWELFLKDEQLNGCDNLEKLVAGCEVIAALDHIDELLAA